MAYIYRISPPDKRGTIMGTLGIPILFAPALGPTLAGWLVQYATWRWIFLINLPVGLIALWIGSRRLPAAERQMAGALDLPGIILGPLAFAALSYGVSEGATSWTSTQTLAGLAVGVLALLAFVVAELRSEHPLLELRVFRSLDFSLAILAQWTGFIALFGAVFLVPLFLQQVRGYGAFDTGLVLVAQALAAAVFMPIGGRLFDRIGARPLVVVGLAAVAAGTFLLSHLSTTTTGWDLALPLALRGAGMGSMMMALNTHLLNAAPRRLVGRVTSLTSALQNVVISLAIAGLSTVLSSRITTHEAALPAHPHPAAITNAIVTAFNDTLLLVAIIAVVGALLGFTLRRNPAAQRADDATPAEAAIDQPVGLEMAG
jgi:EmrB/QacA subfamily drug resistance transporter